MDRRTFLRASAGVTGSVALAGCAGLFSVTQGEPPLVENRPAAVYYPTHTEGMEMVGMSGMGETDMNMNGSGAMGGMNDSSAMAMERLRRNVSERFERNGNEQFRGDVDEWIG